MDSEQTELVIPRQLLCCKICEEEFTDPCYLPCLHTFCYKCIRDHRQSSTDEEGFFPCPTCLTEVSADENESGEKRLPPNILARRLSISATESVKRETLCCFCKNTGNFVEGINHCEQCNDFLCKSCSDAHSTQDEFLGHKLQSEEEYNSKVEQSHDASSQSPIIPVCCDSYDPLDIGAVFCVECDLSVCADCHVNEHAEHRCAELVAVAQHFETKVKEPIQELDKDSEQITEYLKSLDTVEQSVVDQRQDLRKHVKERTKQLCSLIRDYEKLLLEDIDRRHEDQLEDIKAKRLDLQMHLEAIKGVKDFTHNLMTYGSYEEKVHLRKKVGYRIRELCEEPLGTDPIEIVKIQLEEPNVTGDTICDMFGTIIDEADHPADNAQQCSSEIASQHFNRYNSFGDSGHGSDTMDHGDHEPELVEIFGKNHADISNHQNGSDSDVLSSSNSSEKMKNVKFSEQVREAEYEDENCFNLENPKREVALPIAIQKECIKGIGINERGDIIIGTTTTVHVLEKRGIVRGQIQLENGWNIHSVSSDGKVSMTVPRGDNRFKVRVLKNDGSGHILSDSHVESFGLNFVTADKKGTLIITSNRYAQIHKSHGKSAKSGGNIAFYESDGHLHQRITNEDFHSLGYNLLEKPQMVVVDETRGRTYVADPGSHRIIALDKNGQLIFQYGNIQEDDIYQGPDLVSIDKYGNIIVTDKREGRIDILSSKGSLKKSFFTDDIPRFVGATPDKLLVTAMPDGSLKFYEYLT